MQPHDPPFRRPHNWNVLHALEFVSPPSPSASGSLGSIDALASLASSGEIPIFLHTSSERDNRSSVVSVSTGNRSRPSSGNFLRPSSSMATFHSTNTFGQPHTARSQVKNLNIEVATPEDASDRTTRDRRPSSLLAPSLSSSRLSGRQSRTGGYWSNRFSSVSDLSPMAVSAYLDSCAFSDHLASPADAADSGFARPSPSVPHSICTSDSIVISPMDHVPRSAYPAQAVFDAFRFPPPDLEADSPVKRHASVSSRSWTSLSSALVARRSISPSPSIISEDFNIPPTIRFRSPLLRNTDLPPSPERLNASQITRCASPTPSNTKLCEPTPNATTSPDIDIQDCPSLAYTSPNPNPPSSSRSGSDLSGGPNSHSRKAGEHVSNLPGVLDWLRGICIELWIDQEGFRAIRPKFCLVGYTPASPAPSSFAPGNELVDVFTHGMAHFRPVRREMSAYHHGTLDSTPVLRRLTRADSEDKDYISRQASLTIKANGVYVVTGTESYDDQPFTPANLAQVAGNILHLGSEHSDPVQLHWRFEYGVDDRKTDTGRLMPGEKTLTPLSFSCSPGLLHHSHGKRIRLMHVLMKSFTPKISAERVVPHRSMEVADSTKDQSASRSPRAATARRSLPDAIHRRVRSSEPSRTSWSSANDGPVDVGANHKNRPASLSGMSRQPSAIECAVAPAAGLRTCQRSDTIASTATRLSRQILSREELAAILASFPSPTEAERASAASPIRPLSPPSYYRHGRALSSMDRVDELGVVLA
ncbi:hypothetical protein L227DRAFT_598379 [Lentinus tigrinus ALCF2SS1-6]|uniref:Uncharacterized protein n=1 Tax=Lentinus tigrinus ALCF2SS1-6 TaxID=1328759 RepID=A0A5C2SMJ1_9APHY|nr:hypothetical protein L227DRAFT_598379 [Lentinus tigrinus ALCF2SS1-6]